jgi:hypothetical protein
MSTICGLLETTASLRAKKHSLFGKHPVEVGIPVLLNPQVSPAQSLPGEPRSFERRPVLTYRSSFGGHPKHTKYTCIFIY